MSQNFIKNKKLKVFSTFIILSFCSPLWAKNENIPHQQSMIHERLSDTILSEQEILNGADNSQILYASCLIDTAQKLKNMYPDVAQDILVKTLIEACAYPEDLFSVYNILLASIKMKKPMSERQAYQYIEKAYKEKGRDQTNADFRNVLLKNLKII
ncbi:hypothetical protein F991_00300 [Acinetobacter sp. CIP-A165]|uniref:hypothetical protein n=1 Tax=Acinetobacter sp. CIP-A165 TaxID=40373 RepID=UPI0002CEE26C|nr:hypothetical protein [Acinetobacter sp. CIP-A165]ENU31815.1 hypothetical protein F991_00300 [Acinetobacter sp. CIP-A165]